MRTSHYSKGLEKKRVKFILAYFQQVDVCIDVSYGGDLIKELLGVTGGGALVMFPLLGSYYLFVIGSLTLVAEMIARTLGIGL